MTGPLYKSAKKRKSPGSRSVAPHLAAGTALGTAAGGSYLLDNYFARLGVPKGMTVNPDAIKAMDAFAKATPADMANPDKFVYRYTDLANKVSRSRLFNEDPRTVAEWTVEAPKLNEALLGTYSRISGSAERIGQALHRVSPRIAAAFKRGLLNKLTTYGYVLNDEFRPVGSWLNDATQSSRQRFLRVHIPTVAKDPATALIRIMQEGALDRKFSYRQKMKNMHAIRTELGELGDVAFNEATGKLTIQPAKLVNGAKGVEDLQRAIDASPVLSRIAANRSAEYRGKPFKNLTNLVRASQAIRSPYFRAAAGILGLGAAGLGIANFKKNRDERLARENSLSGRIKRLLHL